MIARLARDSFRGLRGFVAAATAAAALIVPAAAAHAQSLIRDAEIEETLHGYADPIFQAAGLNPSDVEINIVNDKELNAFAAPGQRMFVYTGLILDTATPNQLKGVIAHETCHIACGHTVRSDMQRAGTRSMVLALGLGLLAALAGAPEVGAMIASSSGYYATLSVLGYSRGQESAADLAAAGYLERTGQSGRGLMQFFEKYVYQEVFQQARRFSYFQSHPISSERVAALRSRVEASEHRAVTDSAVDLRRHAIMKAKLQGFLNPPAQTFAQYPESNRTFEGRYARAIAYYRNAETDKSVRLIDELLREEPNNPYLHELKGQVLFESSRVAESEAPYRRAVELKPDSALLRMGLGQTLINLGRDRVDEGIQQLQRSIALEQDNSMAWRLMAQAWDAKNEPGRARLAAAEERYALGDMEQARTFAARARELFEAGTPEYRRATDIFMTANPSRRELREINDEERVAAH